MKQVGKKTNPDMEKKGASQTEMEDKLTEKASASLEKTRKIKTQVIIIVVSLLVAVIAMQIIR